MNIIAFSLLFLLLICLGALSELNLLMNNWRNSHDDSLYTIFNIDMEIALYGLFELVLVTFTMLFFVQRFLKTSKSMFIFIFAVAIFAVIYGGVFNNYFNGKTPTAVDPSNGYFRMPYYHEGIFSGLMFIVCSILFPLFAPMQHLSFLRWTVISKYNYFHSVFFIWENAGILTQRQATSWNVLWIIPYVFALLFAIGGIMKRS